MGFVNIPSIAEPKHIDALSNALTDAHNTLGQNYVQKKLDAELIRQTLKNNQITPGTPEHTALQIATAEAEQKQHELLMKINPRYKAEVEQKQATMTDQKAHADFIKLLAKTDMANSFVDPKSETAFYGSGSGNSEWDKLIARNNQENEANLKRQEAKTKYTTALNTYLSANPNSDSSKFYNTELGTKLAKEIAKHTKKIDVVELKQEYRRELDDYLHKNKEEAFKSTPDGKLLFDNSTKDEKSKILYDTALAAYNYSDQGVNENSFKGTDEGKRLSENITKNAQVDSSQIHKAYDNFFYDGGENYKNWQAAMKVGDFNTAAKLVEVMQLDKVTKEADRAATLVELKKNLRAAKAVDAQNLINAKNSLYSASSPSSSSNNGSSSESKASSKPNYVTVPDIKNAFKKNGWWSSDKEVVPSQNEIVSFLNAFHKNQGRVMSEADLARIMSTITKGDIASAIDAVSVPGAYKLDEPSLNEVVSKPTPQHKQLSKDILKTADQARADLAAFTAESPEAILAGLKFRGDSIVEAKKEKTKKEKTKKVEDNKPTNVKNSKSATEALEKIFSNNPNMSQRIKDIMINNAKIADKQRIERDLKIKADKLKLEKEAIEIKQQEAKTKKDEKKLEQKELKLKIDAIEKTLKIPNLSPTVRRNLEINLRILQQTQTK